MAGLKLAGLTDGQNAAVTICRVIFYYAPLLVAVWFLTQRARRLVEELRS